MAEYTIYIIIIHLKTNKQRCKNYTIGYKIVQIVMLKPILDCTKTINELKSS